MTALGPDASDRDPETFAHLKPTHRFIPVEYIEARDAADAAWKRYSEMSESLIAVGNFDKLNEMLDEAQAAERAQHLLWNQLNCAHVNTHRMGGQSFSHGEVDDDIREVCDNCGADVARIEIMKFHEDTISLEIERREK